MTEKVWLGIDPGLYGAVGLVSETGRVEVWDTPTVISQKRRLYAPGQMAEILRGAAEQHFVVCVALEKVHAFPGEGVVSAFRFGLGLGLWEGILAGVALAHILVTPQVWMKEAFGGSGWLPGDKQGARVLAQARFPEAVPHLQRVKDHGRAEALLLAEWARGKAP